MSILSKDAVYLLLQCDCDDRGSPWSLSIINICLPIRKHCAPFSDTGRVHNMFAIDCTTSLQWISLGLTFSACKNRITPRTSQSAGFDIGAFIVTTRYTHNVKKFTAPPAPGNYLHSTEHTKPLIWYNETPVLVVCTNVLYFPNANILYFLNLHNSVLLAPLLLSSHLFLGFQSELFLWVFIPKPYMYSSSFFSLPPTHLIHDLVLIICSDDRKSWSFTSCNFL